MAVWQSDFILIPEENSESVPKENRRDHDWWSNKEFPDEYEKVFRSLFTKSQSWASNTEQFGEESGNIISVSSEHGKIVECFARFDLRYPVLTEYETFISFCANHKIAFVDEQNEIVKADLKMFVESIKRSPAFLFVKDPQEYLKSLGGNKIEE
jgi:hypothetical protein